MCLTCSRTTAVPLHVFRYEKRCRFHLVLFDCYCASVQILACLFYGYFILVRLCVPVFRNAANLPLSSRTLVLAVFHSILPGSHPTPSTHEDIRIDGINCMCTVVQCVLLSTGQPVGLLDLSLLWFISTLL